MCHTRSRLRIPHSEYLSSFIVRRNQESAAVCCWAVLRRQGLCSAWNIVCKGLVFVCDRRQLFGHLCGVPRRQLLSQRRHRHSLALFAGIHDCRRRLSRQLVMRGVFARHVLLRKQNHGQCPMRAVPRWYILPFSRKSFPHAVPCRQLLQQSRRVSACAVSAWNLRTFDRLTELLGLPVRHALQCPRHGAASPVPFWVVLPDNKAHHTAAMSHRALLPLRWNGKRVSVPYRTLLSNCRTVSGGSLPPGPFVGPNWSNVT